MAYEHYQFTIAAMGCLSLKDDNRGPALDQPSYKQCMCEAGMASYCPPATTTASAGAEPTRDPLSVMQSLLEEQLRDALESINSNSLFPENDEFHPDPDPDPDPYPADVDWSGTSSGIELGSGFTWVSLLVLIAFCICLMYRCKYGRGSQEGDNGQEGANERRQNLDRPAEAGYGTTATDSGGGGGGGGWGGGDSGAAQVAPPTDPPPPYELVYSGDTQPPPYEVACQEKAMATSDHPV